VKRDHKEAGTSARTTLYTEPNPSVNYPATWFEKFFTKSPSGFGQILERGFRVGHAMLRRNDESLSCHKRDPRVGRPESFVSESFRSPRGNEPC
jgi:hypothetical protein